MRPTFTYPPKPVPGDAVAVLLSRFAALMWGRPKAWSHEQRNSPAEKARFVEAQPEAVLSAVAEYNPRAAVVFGVEIGHTDPQYVVPSGGQVTVDPRGRRIEVTY